MRPSTKLLAVACGLALAGATQAEEPCALLEKKASEVMGLPAGKLERIASGKTTVCTIWSTDRVGRLSLSLQPKSGMPLGTTRMIAEKSRDPEQTLRDEPSLGKDAFSLREKDKIAFFADGASLNFNKDSGVGDADAERVRALAKALLQAK